MRFFQRWGLLFAWFISLIATFASLFASEILNYEPCMLCWYQRVFMFPLVIILGIAAYRRDNKIVPYAMPLAVIGGLIAIYQFILASMAGDEGCMSGCPKKMKIFGYLDFSALSFLAFLGIVVFLLFARKDNKKKKS